MDAFDDTAGNILRFEAKFTSEVRKPIRIPINLYGRDTTSFTLGWTPNDTIGKLSITYSGHSPEWWVMEEGMLPAKGSGGRLNTGSPLWIEAMKRDAVNHPGLLTASIATDSTLLESFIRDRRRDVRIQGLQIISTDPFPSDYWRGVVYRSASADLDPVVRTTAISIGQIQSPDTVALDYYRLADNEYHPMPLATILRWQRQLEDTLRAKTLARKLSGTGHSFLLMEVMHTLSTLGDSGDAPLFWAATDRLDDHDILTFMPLYLQFAYAHLNPTDFERHLARLLLIHSIRGNAESHDRLRALVTRYVRETRKGDPSPKVEILKKMQPSRLEPRGY